MDEKWQENVNRDMKKCNETRVRLEEHDKNQEKDIEENKRLIEQLFDYKNTILRKQTYLEVNKVDQKELDDINKCLTVLKTEKKFMPYAAMIISVVVAIATLVWTVFKAFAVGG